MCPFKLDHINIDEFFQANWELFVERFLGEDITLLPYGFLRNQDARISNPGKSATHKIVCSYLSQEQMVEHDFLCFTTFVEGTSKTSPPFDFVYVKDLESHQPIIRKLDELNFKLIQIQSE